jgi:TonB family protein
VPFHRRARRLRFFHAPRGTDGRFAAFRDAAMFVACRHLLVLLALAASVTAAASAAPSARSDGSAEDVYRAAVRNRIAGQRALLRPFYLTTGRVVLGLEIDRGGRLVNGAILTGSGSSELDRAAARMATFAAPFAPPPHELAGDPVTVTVVLTLPADKATWDSLLEAVPEPPAR